MASVQVKVTMQNGTGLGLFIKVGSTSLHFDQSGIQALELAPGYYISTIAGNEPSTANVTIEFIESGSSLASQSFSTPTFFGYIPFTVV